MVVASPPFSHPCHYGIDVPSSDELIASRRTQRRSAPPDRRRFPSLLEVRIVIQAIGVRC